MKCDLYHSQSEGTPSQSTSAMPTPGNEREREDGRNAEKQQARTEPAQGMASAVSPFQPIARDGQDGGTGQRQATLPSASNLSRGHHVLLARGLKGRLPSHLSGPLRRKASKSRHWSTVHIFRHARAHASSLNYGLNFARACHDGAVANHGSGGGVGFGAKYAHGRQTAS